MTPGRKFSMTTSALAQSLQEGAAAFGAFQIERNAFLVAVDAEEVGAVGTDEGRTPLAAFVSGAGVFDFDDAGAEIAEVHGAEGPGDGAGQIEDEDAFQRERGYGQVVRPMDSIFIFTDGFGVNFRRPGGGASPGGAGYGISGGGGG